MMITYACQRLALLALAVLPTLALAQQSAASPPALKLILKPHSSGGKVDYLDGQLTIERPNVAAGGTVLRMPLQIVSIPAVRYEGDALRVRDALGNLELKHQDEDPTSTGVYRRWIASRATSGDATVTFRAAPRVIARTTRPGPLFDLRTDDGGMLGAGITFLPLPDTKSPYTLSVSWDLTAMPAGSRGVGSLGEGDIHTVGPADRLAFGFYAAGPLQSYPQRRDERFGMYWLSEPPFDPAALATGIQKLYGYMSDFFHDEGQPYRVFIRKNSNDGGGGTALAQSFMFGWNEHKPPKLEELQSLLAHEMTHNWPGLSGEHGDTAWYSEGAAEYYSIVLSYRAGVLTLPQLLAELNERAVGYYSNPFINASNSEAAKAFWSDWSAQRVPYGRGFMYLAQVDANIRARSHGKRSLDDTVIALFKQKKTDEPGIADWLERITGELGPQAQRDYEAMVAGKTLVPPPNSFAPCFKPIKSRVRPFVLGVSAASFVGERKVVQGLVKDSAAAAAGLRDGDQIIEYTELLEAQRTPDARMKLKVRRGDQELQVDYLPRGDPIESYQWERVSSVPDSQCKV